jgi:hypothetical protein
MTDAFLHHSGLQATRLVRCIEELAVTDVAFSADNLSGKLGRLLDFRESMRLSALHASLGGMTCEPASASLQGIKTALLHVRLSLVESVLGSYRGEGAERIKLPTLESRLPLEALASIAPYQRFYLFKQRDFESRIQILQQDVREALRGMSVEMAQLAALDESLLDSLSMHTRRQFSVVPGLLCRRFDTLLDACQPDQVGGISAVPAGQSREDVLRTWVRPGAWLDRFCREMQGLLLAELEFRLLPVLGLLEAATQQAGARQ